MGLWQRIGRLLDPAATHYKDTFTLGDRGEEVPEMTEMQTHRLADVRSDADYLSRRLDRLLAAEPMAGDPAAVKDTGDLAASLQTNLERLRRIFVDRDNFDLMVREVTIATEPPLRAAVVFLEGLAEKMVINAHVLQPLMLITHLEPGHRLGGADPVQYVLDRLLPGHETRADAQIQTAIDAILMGDCAIFLDGSARVITVETKAPPVRSVSRPVAEEVIRGPQDAFNESFRINVSLVRRRLKHPRTVVQLLTVGRLSRTTVAMMYVDGIVNPKLIAEVKRRVNALKLDYLADGGVLEQLIEDSPTALVPQVLATERPDRVAASLAEGRIALLADNSPYALVLPIDFWALIQTAEDYYLRWPYGNLLRWVRFAALVLALLTPALYVAATNYHHEMIPTELMLSIAATRELVPFPVVVELVIMELAFELIREAGIRIPHVIGPTIGIVGALILGQAAVEAKIVSPILVLIVAITGLASFAIPNYTLAFAVRALRFIFIALAAMLGLYGVAAGLAVLVVHLVSLRAFGLPYLTPTAPLRRGLSDTIFRGHPFVVEKRPRGIRPVDVTRAADPLRRWDPLNPKVDPERPERSDDGE